jgi:hypothetical protein
MPTGDMSGGGQQDLSVIVPPPVDMAVPVIVNDLAFQIIITPLDQTLSMVQGTAPPTLTYTAVVDGQEIAPSWSVDRGELAAIDPSTGVLTPVGTVGGVGNVTATYLGQTASTTVTINLAFTQTGGDPDYPPGPPGAGGYGGVGGDGPAPPATPVQQTGLDGPPVADTAVKILYPYDGTVWPRGLLAPLLQWDPATHKFDSVKIQLSESSFTYTGYFAAQSTATGFSFKNIPLPQAVWKELGNSNNGIEAAVVTITFGEAGKAVGPYRMSWKIARGSLRGTVYYNSYGTAFVQNSGEPSCGPNDKCYCAPNATNCTTTVTKTGPAFGAATLGIHPGDTAPTLVAGKNISNPTNNSLRPGCRACHSVSANGQRLIANDPDNDYTTSYAYDLTQPPASSSVEYGSNWIVPNNPNNVPQPNNTFCSNCTWSNIFPAFYPTGQFFLSSSGNDRSDQNSYLYNINSPVTGNPMTNVSNLNGLRATLPVFSPDGKHVAFNDANFDQRSLGLIDFDVTAMSFANHSEAYTPASGAVSWSTFLPTSKGVVFQIEKGSLDPNIASPALGYTRWNTGELWWYDTVSKKAAPLATLNGYDSNGQLYLPTNAANNHAPTLEPLLNYEPTACPIASGGYGWVVFSSRRIYGNVATIDGYMSDPRNYDWQHQITTKKLWVAAVDLNSPGGTDPSHPAFYLPAQELYAGNARGFWTAVPCHKDGDGCDTGDECCGGYCRLPVGGSSNPDGGGAGLQCLSQPPACATVYEKCSTDADCCGHEQGGITCINNICSTGPIT